MNAVIDKDVRFAEPFEIMNATSKIDISRKSVSAGGVPVISNGKEMYVDGGDVRTMTIADSGAGKTRRVMMPLILSLAKNKESMVIHDPKGELYKQSISMLRDLEYDVKVLNFRNPMTGNRYNPLDYPAKLYKAGEKSRAIEYFFDFSYSLFEPVKSEKDPFWTNESENYVTALCILACELCPEELININNVIHLHTKGKEKAGFTSSVMKTFFENVPGRKGTEIWRLMEATIDAPSDTRASILSVMTQVLSRLVANADLIDLMSESDFDIEEIGKRPTAVFLISKDETSIYNTIISCFVQQVYIALIDMAERSYNGVLPVRTNFVMDEFGNMAKMVDINEKITASRSRNIRWHFAIQSMEQLSLIYGKEIAGIIFGNCDTWIYIHSNDVELLEDISKRCGVYYSEYTREKRKLLSESRLQHLNKERGEALVLMRREYPFITCLPDISEYEYGYERENEVHLEVRKPNRRQLFELDVYVKKETIRLENSGKKKEEDNIFGDSPKATAETINRALKNSIEAMLKEEEEEVGGA